jgi:hypothetical protein
MMFDWDESNLAWVDSNFSQHRKDLAFVPAKPPIAIEDRGDSAVWCVPVSHRVMPAFGTEEAYRRVRVSNDLHVARFEASLLQTKLRGEFGLESLGMLVAIEAFLFRCGYNFAVHNKRCRRIVSDCAAQTQDHHGRKSPIRSKSARCETALSTSRLILPLFCGRRLGFISGARN